MPDEVSEQQRGLISKWQKRKQDDAKWRQDHAWTESGSSRSSRPDSPTILGGSGTSRNPLPVKVEPQEYLSISDAPEDTDVGRKVTE